MNMEIPIKNVPRIPLELTLYFFPPIEMAYIYIDIKFDLTINSLGIGDGVKIMLVYYYHVEHVV